MNDEELKAIVDSALDRSITISSELESDQGDALDYYYGREYGNEKTGRSAVVTREVLETIEWIMPSLMRVFTSGNKTVVFDAVSINDEDQAELETKVVNHVFQKSNRGFEVIHNWMKDALLQKVGYLKAYWQEEEEVTTERYTGLLDEGLAQLLSDDNVDPVEHEAFPDGTHNVTIKRTCKDGKLIIENIPQEEMRVSKNAKSICLDNVDFVAHVTEKTVSDLIEMGYPKSLVDTIRDEEAMGELEFARETYSDNTEDYNDESMRPVIVNECYIRTDYDGDGKAELRRVLMAGNQILENDEWDVIPFAALTPIIMPHKHIGLSEADLVMDLQLIKSTLMRQMLDNLYLTNNPEKEVLATAVNMDDLLKSQPGGIKRVKQMGSIREIVTPFTAGASFPMLEALDGMKEARTGVSRHTMGLDADTLAKSTKGAFQTGLRQANQRIEMLARTFAETGVKDLFLKIHALLIKHQDRTRDMKIDNQWLSINPSEWRERKQMSVVVGIGTGDRSESLMQLVQLAEKQGEMMLAGSPLVDPQKQYNTLEKIIELAELKDVERYFNDPSKMPPQKPKPPSVEEQMAKAQMQLAQMQAQAQQMQAQANLEKSKLEQQKLELQIAVEREKIKDAERGVVTDQQNIVLKASESERKAKLEESKLALEMQLKQRDLELKERELEMDYAQQIRDFDLKITDQMTPILQSITELQASMNAPKRIIRDESGEIVGIDNG